MGELGVSCFSVPRGHGRGAQRAAVRALQQKPGALGLFLFQRVHSTWWILFPRASDASCHYRGSPKAFPPVPFPLNVSPDRHSLPSGKRETTAWMGCLLMGGLMTMLSIL